MKAPDGSPIVGIEFHRGRPHSVQTERSTYDFDYSRIMGCCYYSRAGSGGAAHKPNELGAEGWSVWLAPGRGVVAGDAALTGAEAVRYLRRRGFAVKRRMPASPFDDAIEGRTAWCKRCRDNVPEDEPCKHP